MNTPFDKELEQRSLRYIKIDTTSPSTLAMCLEGSLDQQFLERFGNTGTFVLQDGKLNLNLFADAGNLVFQPK